MAQGRPESSASRGWKGEKGFEGDLDGADAVFEVDLGDGEGGVEVGLLKAGEAGDVLEAEAFLLEVEGREEAAFEDGGEGGAGGGLDPDGGEGVLEGVAIVGAVEDLPVL